MAPKGGYSIEVEGTEGQLLGLGLFVALDDEDGYAIAIGGSTSSYTYMHTLTQLGPDESAVVAECAPEEPKPKKGGGRAAKKPIRAVVRVDARRISFRYGGDEIFDVPNGREATGAWGLAVRGDFGELTFEGPILASWIDGRQDETVQAEREAFERTYVDPPELAAWSDARPSTTAEQRFRALLSSIPIPGRYTPEQKSLVDEAIRLKASGDASAAAQLLASEAATALDPGGRALMRALCAYELDLPIQALEQLDVLELHVELTLELEFLRARLLAHAERGPEAIELLRALAKEHPSESLVHLELTEVLLDTGRHAEAREALERGLAASGPMDELDVLRRQLAKASLGPDWRLAFRHSTDRFEVGSDLDAATCRLAGRELDETWERLCAWLGPPPELPSSLTKVFLSSGEASYRAYIADIADWSPENSLGAYSRTIDQVVDAVSGTRCGR